jgi:glutathione synthase
LVAKCKAVDHLVRSNLTSDLSTISKGVAMADQAANKIYDNYPPTLTIEQEEYLVQRVKDYTAEHGLLVRPGPAVISEENNKHNNFVTNAPVTLFPSPFPKNSFEQAQSLQQTYNELYARIACDAEWLEEIMKE